MDQGNDLNAAFKQEVREVHIDFDHRKFRHGPAPGKYGRRNS